MIQFCDSTLDGPVLVWFMNTEPALQDCFLVIHCNVTLFFYCPHGIWVTLFIKLKPNKDKKPEYMLMNKD